MKHPPRISKEVQKIFKAKEIRRRKLAKLSFEEKIHILIQLQKIAAGMPARRGVKRWVWRE